MPSYPIGVTAATADSIVAAVWPSFEEALLNRSPPELEPEPPTLDEPAPVAAPASGVPPILGPVAR